MAALREHERWGVWGGYTKRDRIKFMRYLHLCGFRGGLPPSEKELLWELKFYEGVDW